MSLRWGAQPKGVCGVDRSRDRAGPFYEQERIINLERGWRRLGVESRKAGDFYRVVFQSD